MLVRLERLTFTLVPGLLIAVTGAISGSMLKATNGSSGVEAYCMYEECDGLACSDSNGRYNCDPEEDEGYCVTFKCDDLTVE
mgnify:CR=1 FL=1